jgi:Pectate lyase superfamily protein
LGKAAVAEPEQIGMILSGLPIQDPSEQPHGNVSGPSKPTDGVPAVKADLRANLLAAKNEIEPLQTIATASVKQFGAVDDGVTDDTASIQGPMDATAAAGGVVFFPPGHVSQSPSRIARSGRSSRPFGNRTQTCPVDNAPRCPRGPPQQP